VPGHSFPARGQCLAARLRNFAARRHTFSGKVLQAIYCACTVRLRACAAGARVSASKGTHAGEDDAEMDVDALLRGQLRIPAPVVAQRPSSQADVAQSA